MDQSLINLIKTVFTENDIEYAALFGSRVRGDNRSDSDYDILIRFKEGQTKSLFGLMALQRKLSGILKQKVDLVTVDSLSPYMRERVMSNLQVIYQ